MSTGPAVRLPPLPLANPPSTPPQSRLAAPGGGAGGGGWVSVIPVIGGLLDGLFGGGSAVNVNVPKSQFIDQLRLMFPDQNAPICGVDIPVNFLNGGAVTNLNIPCDDPTWGMASRSTLEWAIGVIGFAALIKGLFGFLKSPAPAAGSTGSGEDEQITNIVNVTDNSANLAVQSIADAIAAGLSAANDTSSQALKSITGDISTSISGASTALSGFVSALETQIPSTFDQLVSSLINPVNLIQTSIASDIGSVNNVLDNIVSAVLNPLGVQIGQSTAGFNSIEAAISGQIGSLTTLFGGLQTAFLSGIPDAINNVEKVLERIGAILTNVTTVIDFSHIDKDLKRLGDEIAGIAANTIDIGVSPGLQLSSTCKVEDMKTVLASWQQQMQNAPWPINWLYLWFQASLLTLGDLGAQIGFWMDQGRETLNEACPLTKLDPGLVVQLWRRTIVDGDSAKTELSKLGYSDTRIQALYDSTIAQLSPGELLSMWWRQIIDDATTNGELGKQGYTASQIQALKELSQQPGRINDATTGWLRGILDDSELDLVVKANQLSQADSDLIKQISRRPPTSNEVLEGENVRTALGGFSLGSLPFIGTDFDTVPSWFSDAGKAEGLDDQAIQQRWWAHWQIPPPSVAIQQLFRGIRTYPEVQAIMGRYYIPSTLQLDLINAARPLIPFRTIPAMLVNGVLNESEATHLLQQHGFDDPSIGHLLAYAKLTKPKASSATAAAAHATSISTARTLFEDGAITEQQYSQVLTEHGLAQSAIDAELQIANLQEAIKARKQAGTDIVNEFQAGEITIDQARQQLAQQNFTVAEQAKYLKQLKTAKTAVNKIPSEADLNHFLQKSLITADQYVSAMEAQGYSATWAQTFLNWRTAPTTPPAAGTTQTTTPAGG